MFEFDIQKSKANKIKHGIDFDEAKTVDEKRYLLIAKLEVAIWTAVFTYRNDLIRIISVRKSRENEKAIYYSS